MLPMSFNVQYGPINSQQHVTGSPATRKAGEHASKFKTDHHLLDRKGKPNQVSTFSEKQSLMSSTPVDSEEEDKPSKPSLEAYKMTTIDLRNNRSKFSDV